MLINVAVAVIRMRKRLLTDSEVKVLKAYVESNQRINPNSLRVLKCRIKQSYSEIVEEHELIRKAFEKWQKEAKTQ